ncbi:DUF1641 domain-containing protein [Halohasta salina]|uniref:DUF1641 domain-containing protein n=1 Tax=Halohasta salina TaxID=2961621 RepID=UPI0020A2C0CB|nr:hypothetical protein [Halohasta salina]
MAEPTESVPETATNRARKNGADGEGDGQAAVDDALSANAERLAALIHSSDEVEDALETAILVIASADEEELDEITDSAANLVTAADGLSTDGAAMLATELGENADELSASLDTVVTLQQDGHLDDLVTLATAFTDSLSADEIDRLSTVLAERGPELVAALEAVTELQKNGELDALLETAVTLSALDVDREAVRGLNDVLGAVGEARREAEPVSLQARLRQLTGRDVRASLGYLLAVLHALGRRLRGRQTIP